MSASVTATSAIAASGNLGTSFDKSDLVLGLIHIGTGWEVGALLGFKVSPTEDGTYQILRDDNGALVGPPIAVVASNSYAIDPQVFGAARFVKPWSRDAAGANVTQTAGVALSIDLI